MKSQPVLTVGRGCTPASAFSPAIFINAKYYSLSTCMGCGVVVLQDEMIHLSMELVCLDKNEHLEYLYDYKRCPANISDLRGIYIKRCIKKRSMVG